MVSPPHSAAPEQGASHTGVADDEVLRVEDLSVEFRTEHGWVRVVDRVQLAIARGQTVGLVGESGSGKTVTSLAVMGLLPRDDSRIPQGSIRLAGRELVGLSERELSEVRGPDVAMIFQEPRRSLDPAFSVGDQVAEVFRRHRGLARRPALAEAARMLDMVGISDAKRRVADYPHQFSGGMCQRVMLAMALACEPKLLIADEPTTALDVTVQAEMLRLMNELQAELDVSILFITHDLAVVAEMCDLVTVMYAGQVVEVNPLYDLFARPQHPYTEGLLAAIPDHSARGGRLQAIQGAVPAAWDFPTGCRFHPRCDHAVPGRCDVGEVSLRAGPDGRPARCVRLGEIELAGTPQ
ncbi:ABC transporter ATP-binding protein [Pseudonocardia kunmingensis]|uniref:Peptide/nickel transport system ATP-binding protein/oligopeptide transport system ATP-binding protein n=1 Tax=Pseudonocardia kunmingensis TaxID=630975 RepID=A0A543DPV2_9PSEU|nr:ABC transporter ATP-binding protein [Pseudonocardia kunmingensis]TQM11333.1 peptide/nickel transport system ATP-binding protein/oligopeptide transport system ATP-binding protein [Pseudonocardia kunmingensis]